MKKKVIIIIAGIVLVAIGGLGYWLVAPLFITKQVNESLEDIMPEEVSQVEQRIQTIAQGTFIGLAGHNGQGTATLVKIGDASYVRFQEDFQVTNGPDLFVYLGKDGEYAAEARLDSLKGNVGSQNYKIPENIDLNQYNEVWVWCRAFSVPFAKAMLVTL